MEKIEQQELITIIYEMIESKIPMDVLNALWGTEFFDNKYYEIIEKYKAAVDACSDDDKEQIIFSLDETAMAKRICDLSWCFGEIFSEADILDRCKYFTFFKGDISNKIARAQKGAIFKKTPNVTPL